MPATLHTHRPNASRPRRRAGFTLLELMVVVVIIGVLAAIVLPQFMGVSDDARVAAAKAQISSFRTALHQYKLRNGSYPSTSEGLQALVSGDRKYLDQDVVPQDPWGNDYVYRSPGQEGHPFEIISYGEDGMPGGTGYAADIKSWDLQGRQ